MDALGKRPDLGLQCLQGAAGQGLVEGVDDLGEILPQTGGNASTSAPIPTGILETGPSPIPLRPAPAHPASPPPSSTGPIRFECSHCRTAYTVNPMSAGTKLFRILVDFDS